MKKTNNVKKAAHVVKQTTLGFTDEFAHLFWLDGAKPATRAKGQAEFVGRIAACAAMSYVIGAGLGAILNDMTKKKD